MRCLDAHNALRKIMFFHGGKKATEALKKILDDFAPEDWNIIKNEFPDDYPMMVILGKGEMPNA